MQIEFTSFGAFRSGVVDVSDPDGVRRVMAFFPRRLRGEESALHGGWMPAAVITALGRGGVPIEVVVSSNYNLWTCGHGDWPVHGGADALKRLLAEIARRRW